MAAPRPDPDVLLQHLRDQASRASRGRLRIYFGASAGVGKTWAMLDAGRQRRSDGVDVVVGVVETHGRVETAAQLQDLAVLPPAQIENGSRTLPEFDLDGALARHPALILVDEFAHSNVAGSRHPKRWQDVEELLDHGIDVYTTLNVQHLESLNDVVGGITGIRVHETVPDTVFDAADEVVMVDTPADELIGRLRAGKVYLPAQAERAAQNFFRKGNLMALRELALRRTADRIEDDVQVYRVDQAIRPVWKTEAALLCCIGPRDGADHVVRSAARLAQQLSVAWHAVYVETPALQRLGASRRERILQTVKLAEALGATTAVLTAQDVAGALVAHARHYNLSKLLMGRHPAPGWWRGDNITTRLTRSAPEFDLIAVGAGLAGDAGPVARAAGSAGTAGAAGTAATANAAAITAERPSAKGRAAGFFWAAGTCVATTAVATPLSRFFDIPNIVMLYLLTVVGIAVRFGRGPAVLAAFANVAAFDYFFVEPRLSFAVTDVQYLLTFGVMLVVGLITGQLTAGLRFQARIATQRESRSRALFEVARDLSSVLATEQCVDVAEQAISREFRARAHIFLLDLDEHLQPPRGVEADATLDLGTARWALDRNEAAGLGTGTLPGSAWLYLPLKAPMRTRGVLALQPTAPDLLLVPEQRRQLETFTVLSAIALERLHYVDVARDATVQMESERLRNSLLSTLSHDLRTPLAALYGLSDLLIDRLSGAGTAGDNDTAALELARAIGASARRMNAMVDNLLEMAKLQSGRVRLDRQWQPIEEVVGSALQDLGTTLAGHAVDIRLAPSLPLVEFDAALIERVLANLVENAVKYTPPGSRITVAAKVEGIDLQIAVEDDGPGLPAGREEALFQKFTRGDPESSISGVGLGLAICRAIVEAHGGRIRVEPARDDGARRGARFCFTLPLGTPPPMPGPEELDGPSLPGPVAVPAVGSGTVTS